MALVKNIHGSADNLPPRGYASWREYWEDKKQRRFSICSCVDCSKAAVVGGHVKKVNGTNAWYIVPLCTEHNHPSFMEPYKVEDEDLLPVRMDS